MVNLATQSVTLAIGLCRMDLGRVYQRRPRLVWLTRRSICAVDGGSFQENREPRAYVRALYRLVQFRADQFGGESLARDGRRIRDAAWDISDIVNLIEMAKPVAGA
jgi:hypothetical protein